MTEKEKQEYMDRLYSRILETAEGDSQQNTIMLEAMLGNYKSKVSIGWPQSIFQNGY